MSKTTRRRARMRKRSSTGPATFPNARRCIGNWSHEDPGVPAGYVEVDPAEGVHFPPREHERADRFDVSPCTVCGFPVSWGRCIRPKQTKALYLAALDARYRVNWDLHVMTTVRIRSLKR